MSQNHGAPPAAGGGIVGYVGPANGHTGRGHPAPNGSGSAGVNGGAHQSGTLPPATPGDPYNAPPQRRTDQPRTDGADPGHAGAHTPPQPMVAERQAPAYPRQVDTHDDLDDDVDVPPFMKR
jgi:hypothetical protein